MSPMFFMIWIRICGLAKTNLLPHDVCPFFRKRGEHIIHPGRKGRVGWFCLISFFSPVMHGFYLKLVNNVQKRLKIRRPRDKVVAHIEIRDFAMEFSKFPHFSTKIRAPCVWFHNQKSSDFQGNFGDRIVFVPGYEIYPSTFGGCASHVEIFEISGIHGIFVILEIGKVGKFCGRSMVFCDRG